jgi:hypothetical protein
MQYENAKDILPASLLEEVQKYAEGKAIYIPKRTRREGWGEASGYREKLNKRNNAILNRYSAGASIMEIAEEFYLSPETIKKIVYGKKVNLPEYSPSVFSAGQYSNAGLGEEWVRIYLESMNVDIPDSDRYFLSELVRMPLRLIDDEGKKTDNAEKENHRDVPLIILFEDRSFHVICGRGCLSMLRKEKKNAHYAFIYANKEEYEYYLKNFGKQFQR